MLGVAAARRQATRRPVEIANSGGSLRRLADIEVRAVWAVLLAATIQVGISNVAPGGSHALHAGLNVLSYVLDAYFIFAKAFSRRFKLAGPNRNNSSSSNV